MVIEIEKNWERLKIGIIGTRSKCFANVLKKNGFNYIMLNDLKQIDSTFDFIFESGVYKIIPEKILNIPKYGFVGTHETPLPEGKGHAPIQWTVLNNRSNLVVSLYKLNAGVDSGELINQHNIHFEKTDTLHTMNKKREIAIEKCFDVFIKEVKQGYMVLRKQSGKGSYHKKRKPSHNQLDLNKKLIDLWDEIRICDNDKYPAWFSINDKKVIIKYFVEENNDNL